jgi:aconitate hydratase
LREDKVGQSITEKIISSHLYEGEIEFGNEIFLKIDHTLIHDSTGTLADLQFEAIGVPKVKTELSVSFTDHNTLQNNFMNADDHKYLQSVAQKYGLVFSKAGNGICHQVYLERFSTPGKTLLGSDSHTPTAGAIGMVAIGAGGLDVAASMSGEPYYMKMPRIIGVNLIGSLPEFVSAKDVILEVLRRIGVKGAIESILEYYGSGVKNLSIPERGTIANMGTETGATTSIFPSDSITRQFLKAQNREEAWTRIEADADARYHDVIEINMGGLEPLIALPHSPGNVKPVKQVEKIKVDQVCIGSCTNSSLRDMKIVAQMLKGRKINPNVSLTVSPGSRQVLLHLIESGELTHILKAGARLLENACGPCIGMGQAPATGAISLRTFNRNFKGRCGTLDASVYLVSPETAVASAIYGEITDPRILGDYPKIRMPESFIIDDGMLVFPKKYSDRVDVVRGPNIKPLPVLNPLPEKINGEVLIKLGNNVTTDDILPSGANLLPLRSNIPEICKHVFKKLDSSFGTRSLEKEGGFIIGGENYGQGSSREHAALCPRYLGVRVILAKSFARIHKANLINFGILPLTFINNRDYDKISKSDILSIDLKDLKKIIIVNNFSKNESYKVVQDLGEMELEIIRRGGKLPYISNRG